MRVSGFRVGDSTEDDDTARQFWVDNRMQVAAADVHRDSLGLGEAYVMVSPPEAEGESPVITAERPEQVITEPDPVRSDVVRAGLKVWRDERSEEHTSELQSRGHLVCRLLLEKKK